MTKTFGFFAGIVATMFEAWVVRQLAISRSLFVGPAAVRLPTWRVPYDLALSDFFVSG